MADIIFSRLALGDIIDSWLATNTPVYGILTNSSTYTDSSTLLDVIVSEVAETNGYARMLFNPGTGSYDVAQSRWEEPETALSLTASGGSIQFDRIYFATASKSFANRAVSNIDATNNRLEFAAAHPFSVNDKVTVTADGAGVVPSALLSSGNPTTLFVTAISNANPYWIQVSATQGGSAIDFGAGTNTIRVRSIDGKVGFYVPIGTTTVNDAESYNFLVNLRSAGNGVNVNVA